MPKKEVSSKTSSTYPRKLAVGSSVPLFEVRVAQSLEGGRVGHVSEETEASKVRGI